MALRLRSANRQLMREINASIVLGLVREHGRISRTEIARLANLSAATVTGITSSLIEQNLVIEESTGASTGGRRPILLSLNRDAGFVLGVKVTQWHLVCAATDLGTATRDRSVIPLPVDPTPDQVASAISAESARLKALWPGQQLVGIGVGIAGIVERPSGICCYSPFLHWRNVPFQSLLESHTGVPVVVENDVFTLTNAFHFEAKDQVAEALAIVTVGRGVGLGLMLDRHPFRGAAGRGGEFGHLPMDPDGPLCDCGNRGCLEAIVSLPALLRDAREATGQLLTDEQFVAMVTESDPRIAPVLNHAAAVFGRALATLVNLLNPQQLVLSGEGAWLVERLLPSILVSLERSSFDDLATGIDIRVEQRDDDFWCQGAAGLLIEEIFRPQLERVREDVPLPAESSRLRATKGGD